MDGSLSGWTRARVLLALVLLPLVPVVAVAIGALAFLLTLLPLLVVAESAPPPHVLGIVVGLGVLAAVITQERSVRRAIERGMESPLGDRATRTPTSDLETTVERLAAQADVDVPALCVLETDAPEAFTVRHDGEPTVVVSEGLLEVLSEDECRGVLAHEVSHLRSRDLAVMRWATLPLASGDELRARGRGNAGDGDPELAADDEEWPLPGEEGEAPGDDSPDLTERAMAAILCGCGRFCARMVAVGREYAADAGAATITGQPAALASALATLDDECREPPARDLRERADALALNVVPVEDDGLLSTHPPTRKRIDRLRELAATS